LAQNSGRENRSGAPLKPNDGFRYPSSKAHHPEAERIARYLAHSDPSILRFKKPTEPREPLRSTTSAPTAKSFFWIR